MLSFQTGVQPNPMLLAPTFDVQASVSPSAIVSAVKTPESRLVEQQSYRELRVAYQAGQRAVWCLMKPSSRPSFTLELLGDLERMQTALKQNQPERPIDFLVYGSDSSGVFNHGGDLALFAACAERGDFKRLYEYARQCVGIVWDNYRGYGERIVTISLVQGDALGGGLEAALSSDLLVAERGCRMGFPEIKLNIFPGMGAHLLLPFRIGNAATDRMIRNGATYTAEELHAKGVVDVLAEPGQGRTVVEDLMQSMASRQNAHAAIYEARRRTSGVTLEALEDIAHIWVGTVKRLSGDDLRRILTVVAAQGRALEKTKA